MNIYIYICMKLLYMKESELLGLSTIITSAGQDEKGKFFILEKTIIYPQGGGQPSDYAICEVEDKELQVKFAKIVEGEARNYYEGEEIKTGSKINIKVDKERRILNTRYHTAGHLIGDIMLHEYKIIVQKGHQFPNEAYLETSEIENIEAINISSEELEEKVNDYIKQNIPVSTQNIDREEYNKKHGVTPYFIPEGKIFRANTIGDLVPVPCGGTHVKNTSEIGKIKITKITKKGGKLKISYSL